MATFTNQATLSYGGRMVSSNLVQGEVTQVLTATKTAVQSTYSQGDRITYSVSILNAGTTAFTGLSVADTLGSYTVGTNSAVPLTYETGSVQYYLNGVLQAAPTETVGTGVTFSGISVPVGGNALLVYSTLVNQYASPTATGTITNTVTVTGTGVTSPTTATETISAAQEPELSIQKAVSPNPVVENGTLTYTFVLQNSGSQEADAATGAVVTDTFNPILSNITVTYNGTALAPTTGYTYNTATGVFTTVAGALTVPAATYSQDVTTGLWTITPGTGTLVVSGTV